LITAAKGVTVTLTVQASAAPSHAPDPTPHLTRDIVAVEMVLVNIAAVVTRPATIIGTIVMIVVAAIGATVIVTGTITVRTGGTTVTRDVTTIDVMTIGTEVASRRQKMGGLLAVAAIGMSGRVAELKCPLRLAAVVEHLVHPLRGLRWAAKTEKTLGR